MNPIPEQNGSARKSVCAESLHNAGIPLSDRVELLFAQGLPAYLISLVNAGILSTLLWPVCKSYELLIWFGVIGLISMLRWGLAKLYLHPRRPDLPAETWHHYFLFGTACAGLSWGSAGWFFFPAEAQIYQFILIFVLAGMAAAAVPILAASQTAFWVFTLPALGPLIGRFLSASDSTSLAMGALGLLYVLGLAKSAQTVGASILEGIRIRHENSDLLNKLNRINEDLCTEIQEHQQALAALRASEQCSRQQSHYQANHDLLTGLANRYHFDRRLQEVLDKAKATRSEYALCFMDLDQFRIINTHYGYRAGDALLCQLAAFLSSNIRQHDVLARLGGDEFVLLLTDCNLEQASRIAQTLCRKVEQFTCCWDDQAFSVSLCIGIAMLDRHTTSVHWALGQAESACLSAKKQGRGNMRIAHPNDTEINRQRDDMQWLARLEQALAHNQFKLYYQPIKALNDATDLISKHYEILLRLDDGSGGLISPGTFFPIAERYGLAPQIDRWVIETVFGWLHQHRPSITSIFAINLSGQSLSIPHLAEFVADRIEHYELCGAQLCFEITETAAIANLSIATELIRRLRALGCHFALDDFGSGLSSFAYLKHLDVEFLKIDGLFVKDIAQNSLDRTMVQSIHEIGHALGKKTIAEHVENEATLQILRDIGVDYSQGFHIGMPEPLTTDSKTFIPSSRRAKLRVVS